jgi:Tol biopolymer transport system component
VTSRATRPALLLAVVSILAGGCARVQSPDSTTTPRAPNPATALAVSVLADSIYLVDPATGQRAMARSGLSHFQAGFAVWSPDRWRLAYGDDGIFLLDPRTGQVWTVTRGKSVSMPAWSPDGRSIAYGDGISMWVTEVDRFDSVPVPLRATLAPLSMSWQPSEAIAFQGLRRDCTRSSRCTSTDESEIWTVQADGTALRRLTDLGHAESPKWSPDGRQLLFVWRALGGERRELWVVGADGTEATQLLAANDVVAADWSPDGERVALVRTGESPGTLQVWLANRDGTDARPIGSSFAGFEASIDW